jgi:hypothetical protein
MKGAKPRKSAQPAIIQRHTLKSLPIISKRERGVNGPPPLNKKFFINQQEEPPVTIKPLPLFPAKKSTVIGMP